LTMVDSDPIRGGAAAVTPGEKGPPVGAVAPGAAAGPAAAKPHDHHVPAPLPAPTSRPSTTTLVKEWLANGMRGFFRTLVLVAGGCLPETAFPVGAGYDGDNDVDDNIRNYRPGGHFDGDQQPSMYVHTRTKGDYVVAQYWLYYVDNRYVDYHDHDWEPTSVYLK